MRPVCRPRSCGRHRAEVGRTGAPFRTKKAMPQDLPAALAGLQRDKVVGLVESRIAGGEDPLAILMDCRQGMSLVGERFQAGEYYLAELLLSAEIFKTVVALLEPHLKGARSSEPAGTVVHRHSLSPRPVLGQEHQVLQTAAARIGGSRAGQHDEHLRRQRRPARPPVPARRRSGNAAVDRHRGRRGILLLEVDRRGWHRRQVHPRQWLQRTGGREARELPQYDRGGEAVVSTTEAPRTRGGERASVPMKAPDVVEEDPLTGEIIGSAVEVHTGLTRGLLINS
jgi:hypothetical protein